MSPTFIRAFRVRKRHVAALAALVLASLYLVRLYEVRAGRLAVEALAWSVANRVIVTDPGHGGPDPGVVSRDGVQEKDLALAISRRLAGYLGEAGAMVLLTREADTGLSDPATAGQGPWKREDLIRRVTLANDSRADLYLSIHVNSSSSPGRRGAQTFAQTGSAAGKMAAEFIQAELAGAVKNTGRRPLEVDHFITRNTSMPAVIVETGFLTNRAEARLLQDPHYQDKVARAIYAGVVKYFARLSGSPGEDPGKEEVIKTFRENETKVHRP
ncbi:MAG: Germination-specific N-acetylmuramoyl-L-alanine amidase precursor [Firmicutes bacterium ADurb.Bin456]|nr:MAG: Germination-specific N-acetylmuramoyl-L-alanine amidase precursor [Firmicutes bacterium ADurb.Bin456]